MIEPKDLPEASQEIKPEAEVTNTSVNQPPLENIEKKSVETESNNQTTSPVVETSKQNAQKGGQVYGKREKLLEKKLNNMRKSIKA